MKRRHRFGQLRYILRSAGFSGSATATWGTRGKDKSCWSGTYGAGNGGTGYGQKRHWRANGAPGLRSSALRHLVPTVLIAGFGGMAALAFAQDVPKAAVPTIQSGEELTDARDSDSSE